MEPVLIDTSHRARRRLLTPWSLEQKLRNAIKDREGIARVRDLVERGADISCVCDNVWTPLTLAAFLGQGDVVAYLLQCIKEENEQPTPRFRYRTRVDSVNDGGQTALHCAAQEGHADVCRILLEAGADVNIASQSGKQTPLVVAVLWKQPKVIDVLLEWGADVQMADNVSITPLYAAVDGNLADIVKRLIDAGSDVNIGSQDHAPLFLAARRGYLTVAQMLFDAGCCKNITNKYGVTPLYEAAFKGQNEVLQFLVNRGCDLNKCDMYGVSPLQAAVLAGNLEAVKMLVDAGAYLKWRNSQGQCAVQIAIEMGRDNILEYFLKAGVDVSKRPNLTYTGSMHQSPLRITFERSVYPRTMLLLLRGCCRIDLRMITNLGYFRSQPVMLELAFASGQEHPPTRVLTLHSVREFSVECQHWLADFHSNPMTLKGLSRACIRRSLGNTILHDVTLLKLPRPLEDYVTFADAQLLEVSAEPISAPTSS